MEIESTKKQMPPLETSEELFNFDKEAGSLKHLYCALIFCGVIMAIAYSLNSGTFNGCA
jgi:hypothetical protein